MLSVVIPCYNCARYIDAHLEALRSYLQNTFQSFEIIAVDDGSYDETLSHLRQWEGRGVRVIALERNQGKGSAVQKGILEARGEHRIFTDADIPYGTGVFATIVEKLKEADVVLGARLDDGTVKGQRSHRTVLSRVFAALATVALKERVPDTQAGIKGFRKEAAQQIFSQLSVKRFCFDVELIAIAQREGLNIASIPVQLQNQESSTVSVGSDGLQMLLDLVKIFFKYRVFSRSTSPQWREL